METHGFAACETVTRLFTVLRCLLFEPPQGRSYMRLVT